MSPSLTTQFNRSLSALPLLAVALAAVFGAGSLPPPVDAGNGLAEIEIVVGTPASRIAIVASAQGAASTLPGDAIASGPRLDCVAGVLPPGARGLARMPGDITSIADRLRCAQ